MIRETFLSYKSYLWLWLCFLALVVMVGFYLYDSPIGGPNGGTVLGYTYGGIATAGIVYLMWYGIRKRAYYSNNTTLRGVLSGHVWIGITLLIVVPLHSGFSFGYNVHTLAYVLMVITILSGIWGVAMYSKMPLYIKSQRGGGTVRQLLEQIRALSQDITQLTGVDGKGAKQSQKSDSFLKMLERIDFTYKPSLLKSLLKKNPKQIERREMAEYLRVLPMEEQEEGLKLIGLVNKKRELVCRAQDEARVLTWIRLWLYFHLPVSIGLCVALAIHIFSVFFYW